MIIDVTDRFIKPIDEIEDDELEPTVEDLEVSDDEESTSAKEKLTDFSDSLIEDILKD